MTLKKILDGLERPYLGTRGMVMSTGGVVSAAHYLASKTGATILDNGGNFIDAAIATSAVLNVVEPYNSHLGGDAFMLIYSGSDDKLTALNSSGPAPAAASIQDFPEGVPVRGQLAVEVPGQVGAWGLLHREFATMPFSELLEPALRYARDGFPCNVRLSVAINSASSELRAMKPFSDAFMPNGRGPRPGEIFVQSDLARTLEILSNDGPGAFYSGRIAEMIASSFEEGEGLISEEDLAGYSPEILEPLHINYRGFDVFEQPPVSQGHILLEELNIIEGFPIENMKHNGSEAVHLMVEALKLSFADRYEFSGDPRCEQPFVDALISKGHAGSRRELIDAESASPSYPPGEMNRGDTTYFAIADGDGNAVSFIQSLFHGFGSGVVVPGTGILMNNRMTGFSLDPSSPNCLKGGKRTMHTLNTYMVFHEGSPLYIGGTPGGDKQVQTNLQVITGLLDWGLNPQEAAENPRWAWQGVLDLEMETGFPQDTYEELGSRGHRVNIIRSWGGSGSVQVIMVHPESGALIAGSDPRCDGCALGL
ncbi:MAG: gamma-glutamyltransferase [Theionarchaea archaeon]|nr:gamma-glutamyltransferase [Theionarchaea archaeon]